MALRTQVIDLPFGGGVDQDEHAHLLGGGPRVATLANLRFQGGGYVVRPSYDDVSSPAPDIEAITEYDDTLLAFTDEGAYRLDSVDDGAWRAAATTGPRAVDLRSRSIRRTDYGVDWVGTAANAGYVLEAWSNSEDGALYYRVVRADTGAPVRTDTQLSTMGTSGGVRLARPHVVAIGSSAFVIACREDGGTAHYYCVVTVSAGVVSQGAVTSLGITSAAYQGMHAQQDGADLYVVTSTDLERFTRSGTTLTNESSAALPANFVPLRVYDNAVGGYVVAVGLNSSSGDVVSASAARGATLSGTLSETTIASVGATDPVISGTPGGIFTVVTRDAVGNLLVAYDGRLTHGATDSYGIRWYECDAQGAPDNTTARIIWGHRLHAHAFADEADGVAFLPAIPVTGDASADAGWLEWTEAAGVPSRSGGGVVRRLAVLYQVDDRAATVARCVLRYGLDTARHRLELELNPDLQMCEVYETTVGAGEWVFGVTSDEGVTVDRQAGVSARALTLSLGGHVATAQHNGTALAATGALSVYDGADHVEQTVLPPQVLAAARATGGFGGSAAPTGTAGTVWSHALVWRYRDARGNLRRSAPTYVPIGNGASTNIFALQFRVAEPVGGYASLDDVYLEVYQSPADPRDGGADGAYYRNSIYDAGGTIYSSVTQLARWSDIRDSGAPHESVSLRTDTTFVDLADRLQLYTNGGVLENDPEPPPAYILGSRDRMWLVDAEDRRTAWFSKPLTALRPVEWSSTQTVRVPAESGDLVALGIAGDYVVLLTEGSIYYIEDVEGPDSTGAGAFPPVRRVSREVGCTNAASVVTSDVGLFFESRAGIYLLTPQLQLVDVGERVEDSVAAATIVGATACPATQQVIFVTSSGAGLAYAYDRGEWSVYSLRPPQGNPAVTAACALRGEHVFVDGDVYVANDDSHGQINCTLTTGWIRLAGLQGFQRILRLGVLGRVVAEESPPGSGLTDYGTMSVTIAYDYDETDTVGPYTIELDDVTLRDPLHWRLHMARQSPQAAIQITIGFTAGQNAETFPEATTGIPVRLELSGLALEVARKRGLRKTGYGAGADTGGA
jgi:hypothetical protein